MEQWLTAVVAFVVTVGACQVLLTRMKQSDAVRMVQVTEQGKRLPAVGGIALLIGALVAILIGLLQVVGKGSTTDSYALGRLLAGVGLAIGLFLLGLLQDYGRLVKKRKRTFSRTALAMAQFGIACLYLIILESMGVVSTFLEIPFLGSVDFGWMSYVLLLVSILAITGSSFLLVSNAKVLVTVDFGVGLGFCLFATLLLAPYSGVLAASLVGCSLGFLFLHFGKHQVQLGRSGLLLLSGLTVAVAFALDLVMYLWLILLVYWVEAVQFLLQYLSKELLGKEYHCNTTVCQALLQRGVSPQALVGMALAITLLGSGIGAVAVGQLR